MRLINEYCYYYRCTEEHALNVPAMRFFALLNDMRVLKKHFDSEYYLNMCDVVMLPHIRKQDMPRVIGKFVDMGRVGKKKRDSRVLDLGDKSDKDIISLQLKAVFDLKDRLT